MASDASRMMLHATLGALLLLVAAETPSVDHLGGVSREKPELSEHLSAVIGEDVAKSIEYKRQVEEAELGRAPPLTTPAAPKSRIQIKTAPNGVDYEYEYVYYYYDEDDEANRTTTERGRSRYQTIERTSKAPAADEGGATEVPAEQEEEEEERLPQNTRFPPRSREQASSTEAPPAKVSVKHPSLELVDSDTFNTADNRNLYATPSTEGAAMEKAAFDLYVILQSEKMAADATEATTEEPTTVEATTEPEPTTTEPPTTTRRTTTTTTEAAVETRRVAANAAPAASRYRLKLRPASATTTTEAPPERPAFAKSRYGGKPGANRANSFGRTLSTTVPSTTQAEPEAKPSYSTRATRTRNRFNLRSSTASSGAPVSEETSTVRARPRATFSGRTRSRVTTAPPEDVTNRTETTPRPRVALPSRPSANRLLAPRKNPLLRGSTAPPSTEAPPADDLEESDAPLTVRPAEERVALYTESTTTSQSGINRLKNRPRIQIQPAAREKAASPVSVFANRKVNPLIARRQFGLTSSTSESPPEAEEAEGGAEEAEPEVDEAEITEAPSSEAPRPVGLLEARRRLPLRRPGTIYSAAK